MKTAVAAAWRLVAAAAILHVVLILPNHPAALGAGALARFPLELPVILLALAALPGEARWVQWVRLALVAALLVLSVLKIADLSMQVTFGRAFNPVGDAPLIEAGVRLLVGTVGPALAVLMVLGALLGLALVAGLVWWATGQWARLETPGAIRKGVGLAAVFAAAIVVAEIGGTLGQWKLPFGLPGAPLTARTGVEKVLLAVTTARDLRAFEADAAEDALAGAGRLLDRIDRDVIIVFIESYGRSSLEVPLYAETHRATLAAAEQRLRQKDLATRSAWIDAPTKGGQSWLSHATLMNGLWIDSAARYNASLWSERATLFDHARASGFETAAVMPAITMAWPEAETMGFDRILAFGDLGYAGLPFNWVTMPDQFTLHALDENLRDMARNRPIFAQVALVSSHAPWVPVPELLDWEALGDGSVFDEQAMAGDPPEIVWRDQDRIRKQYRKAIDYSLSTVFDWIATTQGAPLVLVLGDHPPTNFVALRNGSAVPIHIVGPRHLIGQVLPWGWSEGLLPSEDAPTWRMDELRDRFLTAFSSFADEEQAGR